MPRTLDSTLRYSGTSRVVTVAGTAASATAVGANIYDVRVVSTTNCWINTTGTATAGAGSMYLPAGVVEYLHVSPGVVFSVIQDSAGGTFNMAEMTR
jgi:hypothetical protein